MRAVTSLLKASVVGSLAFALPWVRITRLVSSIETVIRVFLGYGILILILTMMVGFPLILIAEKFRMIRWWFFTAVGIALGASLGGILTVGGFSTSDEVANPFAITFSPFTRNAPGFVDNIPLSPADFAGSLALGAIVGAVLGESLWYFYSTSSRPNLRWNGP
jgi:hypothetical protein